jgi:hypothetical protein
MPRSPESLLPKIEHRQLNSDLSVVKVGPPDGAEHWRF